MVIKLKSRGEALILLKALTLELQFISQQIEGGINNFNDLLMFVEVSKEIDDLYGRIKKELTDDIENGTQD